MCFVSSNKTLIASQLCDLARLKASPHIHIQKKKTTAVATIVDLLNM